MAVSLQQHVREGLIAVINAFNDLLAKVSPASFTFNLSHMTMVAVETTLLAVCIPKPTGMNVTSITSNISSVSVKMLYNGSPTSTTHTITSISIFTQSDTHIMANIRITPALSTQNVNARFSGTVPVLTIR